MAIQKYAGDRITGLSTDTKPTNVMDGALFTETDTQKMYILVSGTWTETDYISELIYLGPYSTEVTQYNVGETVSNENNLYTCTTTHSNNVPAATEPGVGTDWESNWDVVVETSSGGSGLPVTETLTAGESVVAGDLCYLKSDGKYWKANADDVTTASGRLAMANATISADATGEFITLGDFTTSGLTAGATYYIDDTDGSITTTQPTTSTYIVRIIGYAKSTTVLDFKPATEYIELE